MFADMLRKAMEGQGMHQAGLVARTGCSKAAISQYLSGKNEPPVAKKRQIAAALGLDPEYFTASAAAVPADGCLKVSDVARLMHMSKVTIRKGLQQGAFAWGYAIKTSENRWTYCINTKKFCELEGIE